jgi:hypothetical protein
MNPQEPEKEQKLSAPSGNKLINNIRPKTEKPEMALKLID